MKNIAILKQRFGEVSQSVPISEGLRFGKDSKQQKTVMDRLLRLSGASLDGMGGAQQPADAPVVDTAEQVSIKLSLCCTGNCNNYLQLFIFNILGLHLFPGPAKDVEACQVPMLGKKDPLQLQLMWTSAQAFFSLD